MTTKLTQEEIEQLRNIQIQRIKLVENFGNTEMKIQELTIQKKSIIQDLEASINQEKQISNGLQIKYGDGIIDLDKGEFTSN